MIPARLIGEKVGTGAAIEVLLLTRKRGFKDTWEVLVKPGKKAKIGTQISFGGGKLIGEIVDIVEEGNRMIQFTYDGIFEEILDESWVRCRFHRAITHRLEGIRTVARPFMQSIRPGFCSGTDSEVLHFTKRTAGKDTGEGVRKLPVSRCMSDLGRVPSPVKTENILEHHMHSEFYTVTQEAADKINTARKNGGKIIAVGTTSTRTLESVGTEDGTVKAGSGWTQIFIYPGYQFKVIDSLITNFHLPESTLVMLVSPAAFAGRNTMLAAYEEAVKEKYRFFSFGDAMLIK
ncbi:MAG: S-adenosylmethionine:tRNA ribosyltransferase-isomerase [Lachnospira sp.]